MKNILVAALSLIVFETFGALPAGTMLKFENPDQMMHYIKMQTEERECRDHPRPGTLGDLLNRESLEAIVAGIKDHELEKQRQFRDCLNYFSALPSEQFEQFNGKPHPLTWHMDYPVSTALMKNAGEIKKLLLPDERSVSDLINKIIRTRDIEDQSNIDFMYSVYKSFAGAEAGSIAKRVFEKTGKGKREATYSPNIIDLAEWSSAVSLLSDPSYHLEVEDEKEEKMYIEEMARQFEYFKLVEPKTFCTIV